MVDHAALADAELHTPKGADSAADHDMLYAKSGTTSMSQFLEFCGTGYTSTGIYDYATDGAISAGSYITFSGLEDYVYLECTMVNFENATANTFMPPQLGSSGSWASGTNYKSNAYYKSNALDSNFAFAGTNFTYSGILSTTTGGLSIGRFELFNFNQSAPTVISGQTRAYNSGTNYYNTAFVGVHNQNTAMSRLRFINTYANTSGSIYLKGIKG